MFATEVYRDRRKQLMGRIENGLLLFLGNRPSPINFADMTYPFRQDSTFLYFFGLNQPNLAALLDIESGEEMIFGHQPGVEEIIWTGPQMVLAELKEHSGVARALEPSELKPIVDKALTQGRKLHCLPPYRSENKIVLHELFGVNPNRAGELASVDLIKAIVALREIKSREELEQIEMAVDLTGDMILANMRRIRPGETEKVAAARARQVAEARTTTSFPMILTTQGQYLHHMSCLNVMREGDLLIQDCGAESALGYAADITRTMPVSPRFNSRQRDIYELVLSAQELALSHLRPGVAFRDVHHAACLCLARGLKDLGILTGRPEEAVAAGAHALFFPCGVGHAMGLDVHDMEDLGEDNVGYTEEIRRSPQFGLDRLRLAKPLQAGMVVTVEPGLYFIPGLIEKWQRQGLHAEFINFGALAAYLEIGGVRLEDDVVITESGYRLLGRLIPKSISAVESIRRQSSSGGG
jgi:Xaa-Pro aminopeptidase